MSGFSADWLSLREPVDHQSINSDVLKQVCAHFAGASDLVITDLGSGSGSSLRALSPYLAPRQRWQLVDYDPVLLARARQTLADWADEAKVVGSSLLLRHGDREVRVECVEADLGSGLPGNLLDGADLVTSSAFFDLVSEEWIATFCRQLAARSVPLYAVMTYNGQEVWSPPHSSDAQMLAAFHQDQHRDKGFGPAAGPQAADALARCLVESGFSVSQGQSPWQLDTSHRHLMQALASGSADAVAKTKLVPTADVEDWRAASLDATSCIIGHVDVFAAAR